MISSKVINIGGEFEFDNNLRSVKKNSFSNENGTLFINGRSALLEIINELIKKNIYKIYIPIFNCNSILSTIKIAGIEFEYYGFETNPEKKLFLPNNTAIIINHYFGWYNNQVDKIEKAGENCYIIEDATHTFLNTNFNFDNKKNYIFFSFRKHSPISCGGWANIKTQKRTYLEKYDELLTSILKLRTNKYNAIINEEYIQQENFFISEFKKYESLISNIYTNAYIPIFIEDNLSKYKWNEISQIRRNNWKYLDDLIGSKVNKVYNILKSDTVPLGYIIRLKNRNYIRRELIKKRIFTSIHWPLTINIDNKEFLYEKKLSKEILTIPIDQRYNFNNMQNIAKAVVDLIN